MIESSQQPQPAGKKCQRCAQLGLDCIVGPTVLGRPAHKRQRNEFGAAQGQSFQSPHSFFSGFTAS